MLALGVALVAAPANKTFECAAGDDKDECATLVDFGTALDYEHWTKNTKWLEKHTSICDWKGVTCKNGHVVGLKLKANGLKGTLPDSLAGLRQLAELDLAGERPADYVGCSGNDFARTPMPAGLFKLAQLSALNLEYTCLGGTIPPALASLSSMSSLQLHGNYISGTFPAAATTAALAQELTTFKIGRNPISGTLPSWESGVTFDKAVQFNCNFCAMDGAFPAGFFDNLPALQVIA